MKLVPLALVMLVAAALPAMPQEDPARELERLRRENAQLHKVVRELRERLDPPPGVPVPAPTRPVPPPAPANDPRDPITTRPPAPAPDPGFTPVPRDPIATRSPAPVPPPLPPQSADELRDLRRELDRVRGEVRRLTDEMLPTWTEHGVAADLITEELLGHLDLEGGLVVRRVRAGSAAEKAGLKEWDVLPGITDKQLAASLASGRAIVIIRRGARVEGDRR